MDFSVLQNLYSLSSNQKNIWMSEQSAPGTSVSSISCSLIFNGQCDVSLLIAAVNKTVSKAPALRTRIVIKEGQPFQYCVSEDVPAIPVMDFSVSGLEGYRHWADNIARSCFFSENAPLYRFAIGIINEHEICLFAGVHHLISDGFSQFMICNRISRTYLDMLSGKKTDEAEIYPYSDYVSEEEKYLNSPAFAKDEEFWKEQAMKTSEAAGFRSLKKLEKSCIAARKTLPIPDALCDAVKEYAISNAVSPFGLFYIALNTCLCRAGNFENPTVGVPVLNRRTLKEKQTAGMFVSTVPFTCAIDGKKGLSDICDDFSDCWFEFMKHSRYPFGRIHSLYPGDTELFKVMFSYQDVSLLNTSGEKAEATGIWHCNGYQNEQLCIHLLDAAGDGHFSVCYDYLIQLFEEQELEKLHKRICRVLYTAVSNPELPLDSIELTDGAEREALIYSCNRTDKAFTFRSPYEYIRSFAAQNPDNAALIYNDKISTYSDVIREAARISSHLTKKGSLVLILLPKTPELLYSMCAVMQAGCSWCFISPTTPDGRINEIIGSSGAAYIISKPEYVTTLNKDGVCFVDVNTVAPANENAAEWAPDDSAYVVYTSGSTGKPKGVEISALNLCNLAENMRPVYRGGSVLSLCNIQFDAFILESAAALMCGQTLILADKTESENPDILASLMEKYGAGFLSATPSRISALLDNEAFAGAAASLRTVICGGESFPPELLTKLEKYTDAAVYNQYGPSETCVAVSAARLDGAERITVGKAFDNCRLYVLDKAGHVLPEYYAGELCVGGICVGKGYRNAPELTQQVFSDNPYEEGERLYRTGDLAFRNRYGEIEICGRIDTQIKIRGQRIEPLEISSRILSYPGIRACHVTAVAFKGVNQLVAYYVSDTDIHETGLMVYVAEYLPSYMVPACFIRVSEIPLTANGKTDERKLPVPELKTGNKAPENIRQARIIEIFSSVLGQDNIYADSDYYLLGGDSLNAMKTAAKLEETFKVRIPVSVLSTFRTPAELDRYISESAPKSENTGIAKAPEADSYPLSPTQLSIYIESCKDTDGKSYMMPCAFGLKKKPDMQKLSEVFTKLLEDEPLLKTAFSIGADGNVRATVQKDAKLVLTNLGNIDREKAYAYITGRFDFTKAPLMRVAVAEDRDGWMLLFNIHHIICDGLSVPVLMQRLNALISGENIPEHLSFFDCVYSDGLLPEERKRQQLDYWKKQLEGCPDYTDIITDKPRSDSFRGIGAVVDYRFSDEASAAARRLCARFGLTEYNLFSAALSLLFSRLSGQKTVILGTPVSGRREQQYSSVFGPLMRTLPLRTDIRGTVVEYLTSVRTAGAAMLDNSDVFITDILNEIQTTAMPGRNPLYQFLFQMRPVSTTGLVLGDNEVELSEIPTGRTKLELTAEAAYNDGYTLYLTYSADLYDEATVKFWAECTESIMLELDSAGEDMLIDELRFMPQQPLKNEKAFEYLSIQEEIHNRTLENPDAPALIWHGETLSFRELEEKASGICGLLRENGIKHGDVVGLVGTHSPELVAGMLAIIRAGAAYVPFLASFPSDRINYMMETAGVSCVLCDRACEGKCLEALPESKILVCENAGAPDYDFVKGRKDDAVYILFTSGTTGRPKGVRINSLGLANLLDNERRLFGNIRGPLISTGNYTFDIFVLESVLPLADGRCIILPDDNEMMQAWSVGELIEKYRPAIAQLTPSRLQVFLGNAAFCRSFPHIHVLRVGGEKTTVQLMKEIRRYSDCLVLNMYGPTETTVYVSAGFIGEDEQITIGHPLTNCRLYVLDENKRMLTPGQTGEVWAAGICLSPGYVSRPDLTAEMFADDPFFPGEKMYRTGDIMRLRSDGRYECFGRSDGQVKINGIRVETDEVNKVLEMAGARMAVTLVTKRADGSSVLESAVTPETVSPSEIRKIAAHKLMPQLVPTKIMPLHELPCNSSGKADVPKIRELLSAFDENTCLATENSVIVSADNKAEKSRDTCDDVERLWKQILDKDTIPGNVSFMELGGSSLSAMHLVGEYNNLGFRITLEEFYRHPTLNEQRIMIYGNKTLGQSEIPSDTGKTESYEISAIPSIVSSKAVKEGDILLTGATGFLGAHMIPELQKREKGKIICLMRDGDSGRLRTFLDYYFGSEENLYESVEVIKGDILEPHFGMADSDYSALCRRVSCVVHCAADVRHYSFDNTIFTTNSVGTENVATFALDAEAEMAHMSTASVCGTHVVDDPDENYVFTEADFDIGQDRDNQYIAGKIEAERKVLEAMKKGLRVRIFRVGRLVGRYTDGVFQKNRDKNAFYLTVRAIEKLGCYPQGLSQIPIELTPIDICAKKIAVLLHAPATVYHIVNGMPQNFAEIVSFLPVEVQAVPDEEFMAQLAEKNREDPEYYAHLWNFINQTAKGLNHIELSSEKTQIMLHQRGFMPSTDAGKSLINFII